MVLVAMLAVEGGDVLVGEVKLEASDSVEVLSDLSSSLLVVVLAMAALLLLLLSRPAK